MKLLKFVVWFTLDFKGFVTSHWQAVSDHGCWPWERQKLNAYEKRNLQELIDSVKFDIENDIDHEAVETRDDNKLN
jgi:hypothetical protein